MSCIINLLHTICSLELSQQPVKVFYLEQITDILLSSFTLWKALLVFEPDLDK